MSSAIVRAVLIARTSATIVDLTKYSVEFPCSVVESVWLNNTHPSTFHAASVWIVIVAESHAGSGCGTVPLAIGSCAACHSLTSEITFVAVSWGCEGSVLKQLLVSCFP